VSSEFAELASGEQIATAAAALERNGIRSLLAATGADAQGLVGFPLGRWRGGVQQHLPDA
jgi:hypothetical protein